MEPLSRNIENYKNVIDLPVDKAAYILLMELISVAGSSRNNFNPRNEVGGWAGCYNFSQSSMEYKELSSSFMEAWCWLERRGLLIHSIESGGNGWFSISRLGFKIRSERDFSPFKFADVLPVESLNPKLAERVWTSFLIGDYDVAVFQAFKQVEVEVRKAGGFTPDDVGVPLMRKAFHPDLGPLTDKSTVPGERHAVSDLFAGAIGYQKNPHSHRNVGLSDPREAAELIVLANHLLRIVEFKSQTAGG